MQVLRDSGWQQASADELASLCADHGDLSVIGLPHYLMNLWWLLVETGDTDTEFRSYGLEVAKFFQYKEWPIPRTSLLLEAVAAGGKRDKKLVPSHPMRFGGGVGTLFAAINLGDENAAIALDAEFAQIRVILEPGEGIIFPPRNIFWNRSVLDDSELAFTLLIGSLSPE
jgi:hypothetical protein